MSDRETKHDTDESEKILTDTLRIVRAIGYPEATRQMNDDRREIYMRIKQKINAGKTLRFRHLYTAVAAIALLIILPTAYTAYRLGVHSVERTSSQNTIEVTAPYGTITHLTLPDHSRVTLNGGSTLSYPALFDGERQVSLSGEGFFDIVANSTVFIVNAVHLSVKVLGTRFGVKAYDDDPCTVLTLEEGSVKAIPAGDDTDAGILLKPEQQLILNNKTGEIRRQVVNAQEYTSWKDGVLTFRDMTWDEIAVILKRRFNVEIHITSDGIKNERFVALFKHGENLEQILDKLSYKRPWKYIKHNDRIEIIKK
jgi:ferric-dicitrate binding protein FerR (iron transport regulator)